MNAAARVAAARTNATAPASNGTPMVPGFAILIADARSTQQALYSAECIASVGTGKHHDCRGRRKIIASGSSAREPLIASAIARIIRQEIGHDPERKASIACAIKIPMLKTINTPAKAENIRRLPINMGVEAHERLHSQNNSQ